MKTSPVCFVGFILVCCLIGMLAQSTADARGQLNPDIVHIGIVSGQDHITQDHVGNLLHKHGIEVMMWGSLSYGMAVPRKQAEQAKHLLSKDVAKRKYWIWIGEKHYDVPAVVWKDYDVKKDVSSLQSASDPRIPTQIFALLRDPSLQKYTYITRLHIRKRDYLANNGKFQTGYEGEIGLAVSLSPGAAGKRQSFQVYENGKRLVLWSSVEWGSR